MVMAGSKPSIPTLFPWYDSYDHQIKNKYALKLITLLAHIPLMRDPLSHNDTNS